MKTTNGVVNLPVGGGTQDVVGMNKPALEPELTQSAERGLGIANKTGSDPHAKRPKESLTYPNTFVVQKGYTK